MELNPDLVVAFDEIHTAVAINNSDIHNIFIPSCGLCHGARISILVNGETIAEDKYQILYPSAEFLVRYGIKSSSAVMLLDNTIVGNIVLRVYPIGGIYQDLDTSGIPSTGKLTDHYGKYLEEVGGVVGLETFAAPYTDIPSRATDIDGILVGSTSYPGAATTGTTMDQLEARVGVLELLVLHDSTNIPILTQSGGTIDIADRSHPLVQLSSPNYDCTYYYDPDLSQIAIEINPATGEIIWIDPEPEIGTYEVTIYVMSNGIRSVNSIIYLNLLT